mgnify:CR=1 FL=1
MKSIPNKGAGTRAGPYKPDEHRRRSIRLTGYDYGRTGAYFVTLCTQNRNCLFGEVVDDTMRLNAAGEMVQRWWAELPRKFPGARTDTLGVMPNHIHQIIVIVDAAHVGADLRVRPCGDGAQADLGAQAGQGAHIGPPLRVRPCVDGAQADLGRTMNQGAHVGAPLPVIVQWFKTMTTNEYIRGVKELGWPTFAGRLWQRNYYEHIIRNEESLNRIRQYILDNPAQWAFDRENPLVTTPEPENAWQT